MELYELPAEDLLQRFAEASDGEYGDGSVADALSDELLRRLAPISNNVNSVWEDAKDLAESKGWTLVRMIGGDCNDHQLRMITVCKKRAPWKEEDGEYGVEYFTHYFYWRDDQCFYEVGHYMIRSFEEAMEDARSRA